MTSPLVIDLDILSEIVTFCLMFERELFDPFKAFHISVNFICALSWFTESMHRLSKIVFVLILSAIFELLRNLSILFWVFCNSFMSLLFESASWHLTLDTSWSPYLIFELKMLSAILLRHKSLTWFLILLNL